MKEHLKKLFRVFPKLSLLLIMLIQPAPTTEVDDVSPRHTLQ